MRNPLRIGITAMVTTMVVAIAAACSEAPPSVDDPAFAGIDPAVVNETLDSPYAQNVVAQLEPEKARIFYQGMMLATIDCRAYYDVYQQWLATGSPPALPKSAMATNTYSEIAQEAQSEQEEMQRALASGDVSQIRSAIAGESTCGKWVPLKPRDYNGQTISIAMGGPADVQPTDSGEQSASASAP